MTSKSSGLPSRTLSLSTIVILLSLVAFVLVFLLLSALFLRYRSSRNAPRNLAQSNLAAASEDDSAASRSVVSSESWPSYIKTATPDPLIAKPIAAMKGDPRPTWTATPLPTNTPIPSPTPNPTFVSSAYGLGKFMPENIAPGERWIDVDVTQQKLVAYEGVIPVFETLVSTGTANHPTVTGQFRIWLRFQSQDMNGYRLGFNYYLKGVPYVQYFYQDYALHGTFWHSNFGTPMSHGCVNLPTPASEWLYDWAGYGTLVNIHQ